MKPGTTDAPVVVYHDLESWAVMLVLDLVALIALIVAHVLDVDLDVFGVFAYCILGSSAVIAVVGRRRIEMDPTGIRVYRRGRLRLQRPLSSFSRLKPLFAGTVAIVFDDGAWTWIPRGVLSELRMGLRPGLLGCQPHAVGAGLWELPISAQVALPGGLHAPGARDALRPARSVVAGGATRPASDRRLHRRDVLLRGAAAVGGFPVRPVELRALGLLLVERYLARAVARA